MCTILTTDNVNSEFIQRLTQDHAANPHGISLVTVDENYNYQILKTHDLNSAVLILTSQPFKRVWCHTRNATTWARGVTATHAFIQGDYIVMHNGILSSAGAKNHPVDSMLLCDLLRVTSPDKIQSLLTSLGETFANVFIIDTKNDRYHVIRQSSGSLHTDNGGNYSTHPFSSLTVPVPENSEERHRLRPIPAPLPAPAPAPDLSEIYDRHYDSAYLSSSFYSRDESLSESEKIQLKNDLRMINPDTFLDLVYDYGFERRSIRSQEFHDLCNSKQRKHLRQIQRENDRMNKNRKLWGAL